MMFGTGRWSLMAHRCRAWNIRIRRLKLTADGRKLIATLKLTAES
jgi:hypothetical protein